MRIYPKLLVLSMMALSLSACGQSTVAPSTAIGSTDTFGPAVDRGTLDNPKIVEASGLAASRKHAQMLWTHNDSGGEPKVYLIDNQGATRAILLLRGARNRDWEDIAVGPGPEEGKTYLYVGDIGDNSGQYDVKTVYRCPEPPISNAPLDTIQKVDALRFVYPNGPRDAETLLVDPLTKDLYVLSKRDRFVQVYRATFPQDTVEIDTLELLGQLPRKQVGILDQLVGGDVSADGQEVLLKSYVQVFYWKRGDERETLFDLLQTEPQTMPYQPEPQGEAIGFAADGAGYYTLSEKQSNVEPRLYFYPRSR